MNKHVYIAYVRNKITEPYRPMCCVFRSADNARDTAAAEGWLDIDIKEWELL